MLPRSDCFQQWSTACPAIDLPAIWFAIFSITQRVLIIVSIVLVGVTESDLLSDSQPQSIRSRGGVSVTACILHSWLWYFIVLYATTLHMGITQVMSKTSTLNSDWLCCECLGYTDVGILTAPCRVSARSITPLAFTDDEMGARGMSSYANGRWHA